MGQQSLNRADGNCFLISADYYLSPYPYSLAPNSTLLQLHPLVVRHGHLYTMQLCFLLSNGRRSQPKVNDVVGRNWANDHRRKDKKPIRLPMHASCSNQSILNQHGHSFRKNKLSKTKLGIKNYKMTTKCCLNMLLG